MNLIWFKDCCYGKQNLVGGKNASLGELLHLSSKIGFSFADGFALTTNLYDTFISQNQLSKHIENLLFVIDFNNLGQLNMISKKIQRLILKSNFTLEQEKEIISNYRKIKSTVAIRSSALAEDLPNASFAGQQDTYLNIHGDRKLIESIKKCYASLFNARAISYRKTHNISYDLLKISVAIQEMVRSDLGSAGVAFSLDTETGYDKAIVINSCFGLGEMVVSGIVKPDEFIVDKRILTNKKLDPILDLKLGEKKEKMVYQDIGVQKVKTSEVEFKKYSLTENQILELAEYVLKLENEYCSILGKKVGIDVEWGFDGKNIYILQTRPETIHSQKNTNVIKQYSLSKNIPIILEGVAIGQMVSTGRVNILSNISEAKKFIPGDILVTGMTTPDWEPIMKIAGGIVTDKGGRTCHAAIVTRELGINAIVGTIRGTQVLKDGMEITLNCSQGEIGRVHKGIQPFQVNSFQVNTEKRLPLQLMLNVGSPEMAFTASMYPNKGVGLARLEFIINNHIGIHPKAILNIDKLDPKTKSLILHKIGEQEPRDFFIKKLARGIAKTASAFYPEIVINRLTDFKTNEYRNLLGGSKYEPEEENPMIGWRGASRYYHPDYQECFQLECEALKYARENMGMDNIAIMIPFTRTHQECRQVIELLSENGLYSGKGLSNGNQGLKIYLMCEIPSNVMEADKFAPYIDGVSIGGNDLLQLTLGLDRDSEKLAYLGEHTNISYRRLIQKAIEDYRKYGVKVGFCGQQPSDSVEFCKFLWKAGIDSISVTPDSVMETYQSLSNIVKPNL